MREKFMEHNRMRYIAALVCLLAGILSFAVIAPWASSPSQQSGYIEKLDNKKTQVQELTAAATATSIAITMLPGDAATPIANKLADLSQYLLIVLCALYLEKYLVTVMGLVTFRYLVPVSLLLLFLCQLFNWQRFKPMAYKVAAMGLALYFVIPVSLHITDLIETTYASSIETTLESAEGSAEVISGSGEEGESAAGSNADGSSKVQEPSGTESSGGAKSLLEKVMNLPSSIADTASEVVSSVSSLSEEKIKEMETALNHFMESVAVMLITSCVIPILVLLFFFMVIKTALDGRVSIPEFSPRYRRDHPDQHEE